LELQEIVKIPLSRAPYPDLIAEIVGVQPGTVFFGSWCGLPDQQRTVDLDTPEDDTHCAEGTEASGETAPPDGPVADQEFPGDGQSESDGRKPEM